MFTTEPIAKCNQRYTRKPRRREIADSIPSSKRAFKVDAPTSGQQALELQADPCESQYDSWGLLRSARRCKSKNFAAARWKSTYGNAHLQRDADLLYLEDSLRERSMRNGVNIPDKRNDCQSFRAIGSKTPSCPLSQYPNIFSLDLRPLNIQFPRILRAQ